MDYTEGYSITVPMTKRWKKLLKGSKFVHAPMLPGHGHGNYCGVIHCADGRAFGYTSDDPDSPPPFDQVPPL